MLRNRYGKDLYAAGRMGFPLPFYLTVRGRNYHEGFAADK